MRYSFKIVLLLLLSFLKLNAQCDKYGTIVISEVYFDTHYNEDIESKYHCFGEYIELFNSSDTPINLEGWTIKDNHTSYTFNTTDGQNNQLNLTIAPGGFKIITYNGFYAPGNDQGFGAQSNIVGGGRAKFLELFPLTNSYPENDIILQNRMILYNQCDKVSLYTPQNKLIDEVSYFNRGVQATTQQSALDFMKISSYTININPPIDNVSGGWFNGPIGEVTTQLGVSFITDIYSQAIFRTDNNDNYYSGGVAAFAVATATPMSLPLGLSIPLKQLDPFLYYNDNLVNFTESYSYDILTGNANGHSKSYFDDLGKNTVSLSLDFQTGLIWGTEKMYDSFGRPYRQSFPAPTCNEFKLTNFLSDPSAKSNFLDKYYSDTNITEPYQASAQQPYSQTNYDTLNPGNVINVVGGNQINGDWKTGYSYTLPAAQEMYYAFGSDYFNDNRDLNYYWNLTSNNNKTIPDYIPSSAHYLTKYWVKIISYDTDIIPASSLPYTTTTMPSNCFAYEFLANYSLTIGKIYRVEFDYSGATPFYVQILKEPDGFGTANTQTYFAVKILSGNWDNLSEAMLYNNYLGYQLEIANTLSNTSNKIAGLKCNKSISIDANGVENVVFTDTDGKTLATARAGGTIQYSVTSLIGSQGFVDIHLPNGCQTSINFIGGLSLYKVYDLKTGQLVFYSSSNFPSGIYRIELIENTNPLPYSYIDIVTGLIHSVSSTSRGVIYKVNYYDYSLNIYNKTGQLVKSIQPKGYQSNATIVALPTHMQTIPPAAFSSNILYNAQGKVVQVTSPDEGTSKFAYRQDGQIRYSQSAKQAPFNLISYTNYDSFGRPIESGVSQGGASIWTDAQVAVDAQAVVGTPMSERIFTVYDYIDNNAQLSIAIPTAQSLATIKSAYALAQHNLSGNVAVTYKESASTPNTIDAITWYSYDIYGRSEWQVQYAQTLGAKTIDYVYDYKGNISTVLYQKDTSGEKFTHQYTYDLNGSLTNVETASGNNQLTTDAQYSYFKTGELKRTNIAQGGQGIDYIYTLGGQLKSINHPSLDPTKDPGQDGVAGSPNASVAPDLFGISLDYYQGDYQRLTNGSNNFQTQPSAGNDYVGNIKAARWANKTLDLVAGQIQPKAYKYNYNRNNWLTDATFGNSDAAGTITPATNPYAHYEGNLSYDANGNIQALERADANGTIVDNIAYQYISATNRLEKISDASSDPPSTSTSTKPFNPIQAGTIGTITYSYNEIGQLTHDTEQNLDYFYNTQGLVFEVKRNNNSLVKFYYNERGQRIKKESFNTSGQITSTDYYVLDLAGNAMAIYNQAAGGSIIEKEMPIYGLNRLGVLKKDINNNEIRSYQITDHLGNVRAVVNRVNQSSTLAMISFADYYPFGERLDGRSSMSNYRYAFQGQELDGETGMEAFQLRLWDGRIGRWLSPDPMGQYASPYLGMGNNPITGIDIDGGFWQELGNWVSGSGWNSNPALAYQAGGGNLYDWHGNLFTGYRSAGSSIDDAQSTTGCSPEIRSFKAVNDFWSGLFNPSSLSFLNGRVAIGYTGSLNGDALVPGIGVGGAFVGSRLMFLGGKYGGYWYNYASAEAGQDLGVGLGGSTSLNGTFTIAINPYVKDSKPSTYNGMYYGGSLNASAVALLGANGQMGFSNSPGSWKTFFVGGGVNLGGEASVRANWRAGKTILLTPEVETSKRSTFDLISNHLNSF